MYIKSKEFEKFCTSSTESNKLTGNKHNTKTKASTWPIYFNVDCGIPAYADFDVFVLKIKNYKN